MNNNTQLLTITEASKHLRVSIRSIYRYIKSNRLKAYKLPAWRIKKSDLEKFLEECSNIKNGTSK